MSESLFARIFGQSQFDAAAPVVDGPACRQHHEIAREAAVSARMLMLDGRNPKLTPDAAAAAVVDVYLAALTRLSSGLGVATPATAERDWRLP